MDVGECYGIIIWLPLTVCVVWVCLRVLVVQEGPAHVLDDFATDADDSDDVGDILDTASDDVDGIQTPRWSARTRLRTC